MARYFFDIVDGTTIDKDATGTEFGDLSEARTAAADALGDMTREALPNGSRRHLVMRVRDEAGTFVHECTVDFNAHDVGD